MPHCEECDKVWLPGDPSRWEAYWIDDGPDEKLVFYCPECAGSGSSNEATDGRGERAIG
jgi:hypothetical protein